MDRFEITGEIPLKGTVNITGAKNAALKAVIAGLMTKEDVVIENIPYIQDLITILEIVKRFGVKTEIDDQHRLHINSSNLQPEAVLPHEFGRLRASFMIMIPLLVRCQKVQIPASGGDKIGVRPIDRTLEGLSKMGAEIEFNDGYYVGKCHKLKGINYTFSKNTHTGTEALILAAILADGETVLKNAAQEPEIDDLILLLNEMGAKVKRIKDRTIVIQGVKKLSNATHKIMPDRNEVVTFAIAGMITKGDLEIFPVVHNHMTSFYQALKAIGAEFETEKHKLIIHGNKRPLFTTDIETSPYPGFMTDWQAPWTLLMTQTEGKSIIWEKVFDNRFGYTRELQKMGALIELFNPKVNDPDGVYNFNLHDGDLGYHAASVWGPTELKGTDILVPDLRAGATLVLAALSAKGSSKIIGVEHIDRGYEKFDERLKILGAKIQRFKEI